jgi:similar to stage IV sporulation protein
MKDKILKIFSSSIKIKVTGRNINNFLKRLINNNINIEKVIPISHKEIDLIINYQDLDKVLKLKTIYNIKIVRYYGKLRIIKRIKKDIFILSSLLISLLLIYTLSNVIFKVEVIHSNKNIIKLVTKELEDNGIKKYKFVKNYQEIEKIKNKILEENKDTLEWLEIIREGTKYTIRVEERIINNKPKDNKIYNIVASKNAVIKNIYAESGEKIRSINTYVKKGDIIISSDITLPNNEKISKTASGKVQGEVWYNINIEYPYQYHEIKYTGNKKKVLVLNLLNKRISFFDFHKYKTFNRNIKYIFNNNITPISLIYEDEYETNIINEVYDYNTAREKAITKAKEKILEKYPNIKDITDIKIIKEEDKKNKISLNLFVTCLEDITEYQEIDNNKETS